MEFDELAELIFRKMISKLKNNIGLYVFARERTKFEGWFKVELCDSLSIHFENVIP